MSEQPENPPAFPSKGNSTWGIRPEVGMTLRDYFAGQALSGLCANTAILKDAKGPGDVANAAYNFADAMLAERAKAGADQ